MSVSPREVRVQLVLRNRLDEHVAAIVERAAGRTCGTCWRFNGCDREPASPQAVACVELAPADLRPRRAR